MKYKIGDVVWYDDLGDHCKGRVIGIDEESLFPYLVWEIHDGNELYRAWLMESDIKGLVIEDV